MTHEGRLDAYRFHEQSWESYDELREDFEWDVPERFNMAEYVCDRWADDRGRVALFAEDAAGNRETYTFRDLATASNRLANYLTTRGIEPGERVGVNLPTTPETLITHLAAWKLGAVSLPLSTTFGPDALAYRLRDCEASGCIVHGRNLEALRDAGVDLDVTMVVGDATPADDEVGFWSAIDDQHRDFETATTTATEDAFILYTSGTTGDPKGVLHTHQLLLGNLPQFLTTTCNLRLNKDDVFWMPVEWSWIAIFAAIVPALFYGYPVMGHESERFDPERAFELIDTYELTNCLFPPTGLRMMRQVDRPQERFDLNSVRLIMTAGETVGEDVINWAADTFGNPAIHEGYGQTEAHYIIGDCDALMEAKPGKMGRAQPGHDVTVVDQETAEPTVEPGEVGEIALRYEGDPIYFTEYWNDKEKTEAVRTDGWHLTGDLATLDDDGYFKFVSRKDDLIISSGYRIGPEEIEKALESQPPVENAGIIGVPDEERGTVPKGYVVLSDDAAPHDEVIPDLKRAVKTELAAYEYPREIDVIGSMPQTQTGKTRRTELRDREER